MRQFLQRNVCLFLTSFSVMLSMQVHGQAPGAPPQSPNNTSSGRQTPPKKPATAPGTTSSTATPRAPSGAGTPPPGSAVPANDGLDPQYLEFEVLGMRFRPPVQSIMRADGSGITAQWTISERADPPRFVLRVSRLVASDATSTPAQQIDSYVKSVSERPSPNAVFAVRSRKEFELDGRPAALLYTSLREGSGDDEVSAVQGYFILQIAPNEFVVISSLLAEQDFASVSQLLERSFRTMQVANQAALADERSGRIERGDHLLRGLDEEAMRRALDPVGAKGEAPAPRWYRITRVDATGDVKDVGYMTMVVIDAAQGLANPDRRESEWTKTEKERGMLVRMQVRTLLDATGTAFSDTEVGTGPAGIAGANSGPCAPRCARIARVAPQRSWVFAVNQQAARHDQFWKWRTWCRRKLPPNRDAGRFQKLAICRKPSHWCCHASSRKLQRPLTTVSIASIHGAADWRSVLIAKYRRQRDTTLQRKPRLRRRRLHSWLMSAAFC